MNYSQYKRLSKKTQSTKVEYSDREKTTKQKTSAVDFFLNPEEKKEIVKQETSTVTDILDFIDNLNRFQYAGAGVIEESIKGFKRGRGFYDNLVKSGKSGIKGFLREERKGTRDILKQIAPDEVRYLERETEVPLFWGITADSLSVPTFLGDILIDPLSYIPAGAGGKALSKGFSTFGKTGRLIAKSVIGEEAVSKIISKSDDILRQNIYPYLNKAKVWEAVKTKKTSYLDDGTKIVSRETVNVRDVWEDLLNHVSAAEGKSFSKIKDVATVPVNKKSFYQQAQKYIDSDSSKELSKIAADLNDEAAIKYGDFFYDKFVEKAGLKVKEIVTKDDLLKVLDLDSNIEKIADIEEVAKIGKDVGEDLSQIKSLIEDYVGGIKGRESKLIAAKILEKKGFKKLANQIVKAEKGSSDVFAKTRFAKSYALWKETRKELSNQLLEIKNVLKSDVKLSMNMLDNELQGIVKGMNKVEDDVTKAISLSLTEASSQNIKIANYALESVKKDLNLLQKFQNAEIRNVIRGHDYEKLLAKQRSAVASSMNKINGLQSTLKQMEAGILKESKDVIIKSIKDTLLSAKKDLKIYRSLKRSELQKIGPNIKMTKALQKDIINSYLDKSADISSKIKEMDKFIAAEKTARDVSLKSNPLMASKRANQYYKAFNSLKKVDIHQSIMKEWKSVQDEIYEKTLVKIRKTNPDLAEPFIKIRKYLDDQAFKLQNTTTPVLKNVSPLYWPRKIRSSTMKKVFEDSMQYGSGNKGFTKRRINKTHKEFKEWVVANGGEVEDDAIVVLAEYLEKSELAYARQMAADELIKRFNVKRFSDLPGTIKKDVDYLYRQGKSTISNPLLNMISRQYSKGLNISKALLTLPNLAFIGRNIGGFPFLVGTIRGMKHGFNPKTWVEAYSIKKGFKGKIVGKGGKTIDFKTLREAAEDTGYWASTRTRGDIEHSINMALGRYSIKKDPIKYLAGKIYLTNMHIEDWGRWAGAIEGFKATGDLQQALKIGKKAMIDYNLLNSPADAMLQGILGFYTFSRRNLPNQLAAILNRPDDYAHLAKIMERISNRQSLSEEDFDLLNGFEKETFKIFGEAIDGIREFRTLGFFPQEEAYQTYNVLTSGDIKQMLGSRNNPILSSFLDWYYGVSSFTKQPLSNTLPPKYTNVIPENVAKLFGLEVIQRPKYRLGVQDGTETVYSGDVNTIFAIRNIPLHSRFLNDLATLSQSIKEGKSSQGVLKYLTGINTKDLDPSERQFFKQMKINKALIKRAKEKGMKSRENVYIPKYLKNK